MKKFKDREDAAKGLYDSLPIDRMKDESWNLVALSTGGLELAYHINKRLSLPIDILVSAAITAPQNTDCEIARV